MASFCETIAIEGIISVGKTTLVQALTQRSTEDHRIVALKEEIADPLLALFYGNPQKYALMFQCLVLEQRKHHVDLANLTRHSSAQPPCTTTLLDRTFIGDAVFAKVNKDLGNFDEAEWKLYEHLLGSKVEELHTHPGVLDMDAIVFCWDSVENCMERCRKRGISSEQDGVTSAYQTRLLREYWIVIAKLGVAFPEKVKVANFARFNDTETFLGWATHKNANPEAIQEYYRSLLAGIGADPTFIPGETFVFLILSAQ